MFESKKKIELWVSCGDDFFYGLEGEKKDYELAAMSYEKAAKKKHPHAAFMLGLCYELGDKELKKDLKTAEEWYKKAAEYGDEDARKRLKTGKVIIPPAPDRDDGDNEEEEEDDDDEDEDQPEDDDDHPVEEEDPPEENHYYVDNLDLWTLSAEELLQAGKLYLSGNNIESAIDFLEYAAILYNNDASHEAAFCAFTAYMSEQENMREGSLYAKKAFWWLSVAVNNGYAPAKKIQAQMKQVARVHAMPLNDTITLADGYHKNGDYLRARYWFVIMASQKNSYGAYWAGRYYYYGRGVARNYAKAVEWLSKSIEYGEYGRKSGDVEYFIGKIYLAGGYGVNVDLKKALGWLKKAELDSYVCEALGDVYEKLGDDNNAVKYSNKAIKLMEKEEKKKN